ncbi:MAG: hypothetical protein QOI11_3151, partial [Candidatus Eremiobacteraeota bacterium]|nr:hypothetical protein [Candidatus Eremiobacteraeota bacterium]
FCAAALRGARLGRACFVDYAALPDAVAAELLDFFGVPPADRDEERMRAVAGLDTKSAGAAFRPAPDAAHEEGAADQLASRWLDGAYAALRARRGAP